MENRFQLDFTHDGSRKVKRIGHEGAYGRIVAQHGNLIVFEIPGGSYWAGRGVARGYTGKRTMVAERRSDGWWYSLIEWDARGKKRRVAA